MRLYPLTTPLLAVGVLLTCLSALTPACGGTTREPSSATPPQSVPVTQAEPSEPEQAPPATPAASAEPAPVVCDLVCERAKVVARAEDTPDYTAQADANVNAVLDAMRPDLLACYQTRLTAQPTAHGFITATIVIDPQGGVRRVDTTGGAILGEKTMACIVQRIKRGKFDPPRGGGTLTVVAPFGLRRVEDNTL